MKIVSATESVKEGEWKPSTYAQQQVEPVRVTTTPDGRNVVIEAS